MKVIAKWKYYNGEKSDLRQIDIEHCCYDMQHTEAIKFGEFDRTLNKSKTMNIAQCFSYPEGTFYEEEPINFCPFCGNPIEVEIIE